MTQRLDKAFHSVKGGRKKDCSFAWNDSAPTEKNWMPPTRHYAHPFAFYYIRAVQTDGEAVWASPVWIDP